MELRFELWRDLALPLGEVVTVSNACSEVFLAFPYEVCTELPGGCRDLVVLVGKAERAHAARELRDHPSRIVAAVGPGDHGIGPAHFDGERDLPDNILALFAVNNGFADSRAVSVPIGVQARKLTALEHARRERPGARPELCYGNFTVNERFYWPDSNGAPHVRLRLRDWVADAPWVNADLSSEFRTDFEGLPNYYSQIARHKFVLSPEGHGVDCFRTWEALYLGAIPIVADSAPMAAFRDLPILFTDDYSELSEEYLERRWREMSRRSFRIDRMLKSWYLKRFLEAVSKLRSPRFVCLWADESPPRAAVEASLRSARLPQLPS